MQISKSAIAVGGVVLAAGLIGFTNPKTVHALAAALVQVTNTASNPVVTQGVGQQAAQMIHLWCPPYTQGGYCRLAPSPAAPESAPTTYVVPDGQSLVVTAIDITPMSNYFPGCDFTHRSNLEVGGTTQDLTTQTWGIYNNATMHMVYPSGLLYPSGSRLDVFSDHYPAAAPSDCSDNDRFDLYGYLTAS